MTVNSGTLDLNGLPSVTVPSFSGSHGVVTTSATNALSTLSIVQTATTNFGGSFQNGAGQFALVFNGSNGGAITLGGSSNYSGGTTIVAGTLQMGNSAALGSSGGSLTVNGGGLLDVNGKNLGIGSLYGSGTIDSVGAAARGTTATLTVGNGNTFGDFSGSILSTSGAVALVKTGTGQLVLSGVNTYTGGTFLNGGLLTFSPNSIPYSQSSSFTFGGGTLQWAGGNAQDISGAFAPIGAGQTAFIDTGTNSVTFNSGLSGSGGLTLGGNGMLILNAVNSYSGTTAVTGGTLQLGVANALPVGGLRVHAGVLDLNGQGATVTRLSGGSGTIVSSNLASTLTVNQAAATTFGGALQDGSGLSFTLSAGTLTLTGTNNTYSQNTTINGGILKAGTASTLSQWSNMLIGPAGTLDATNFSQTVSSLSVSGALNLTIGNLLNVSNAASFAAGSTLNLFGIPSGGTDELISYGSLDPINNSFTNLTLGGGSLAANDLHYSPAGLSPGLYYYVSSVGGPSTWSFAGSGTWSTPTNWSPAGRPARPARPC